MASPTEKRSVDRHSLEETYSVTNMNRSSSELAALFARSRDGLLSLCASEFQKVTPRLEHLMTVALGLWICKSAVNDDSISMQLIAEKIESGLASAESRGTFEPFAYDSKLLLLIFELLAVHNCRSPGIERFAKLIASEIGSLQTIPPRLIGEALLLSHHGLCAPPAVPLLRTHDISVHGMSLLRMERPDLLSMFGGIAAASHFGLGFLTAERPVHLMLKELLPSLLLQTLREYDLDLGATILRNMIYVGLRGCRAFQLGVEFLMDQQDSQGRFGRLAKEAGALCESGTIDADDVTTRLYLPITVNCLWALAESVYPSFTLVDSLRRYRAEAGQFVHGVGDGQERGHFGGL
jgi:hypothetical protein